MIDLLHVTKTYEGDWKALKDVTAHIGKGEFVFLTGWPEFTAELDVLTADMRSSSYEAALVRFEGRIASPMLSDITRGLIGVLRGDDGRLYFQMLSHDLKQQELQRLKAKAAKIQPKIRVFSFIMLACFMLTYVVVLAMVILDSMALLF